MLCFGIVIETDRQTDRQTYRQTDRQTDRQKLSEREKLSTMFMNEWEVLRNACVEGKLLERNIRESIPII